MAAPAELGAAKDAVLPEADWEAEAAFWGSLRWAFRFAADCAMEELAAAAMGVSRILLRMSLLIS